MPHVGEPASGEQLHLRGQAEGGPHRRRPAVRASIREVRRLRAARRAETTLVVVGGSVTTAVH